MSHGKAGRNSATGDGNRMAQQANSQVLSSPTSSVASKSMLKIWVTWMDGMIVLRNMLRRQGCFFLTSQEKDQHQKVARPLARGTLYE